MAACKDHRLGRTIPDIGICSYRLEASRGLCVGWDLVVGVVVARVVFLGLEWGIKGLNSQVISTTPSWELYTSPSLNFFVFEKELRIPIL